jgi:hypothetical protein
MRGLIPLPLRNVIVWLAAFLSPSAYFLMLLLINAFHAPAPPAILVVTLFILIPVGALVVCESVVWRSGMIGTRRIGWMLFTLFALALQVGILLVIIMEAVTAAISYV